jgi:hypothetical protein
VVEEGKRRAASDGGTGPGSRLQAKSCRQRPTYVGPERHISLIGGLGQADRVKAKPSDQGARLLRPTCKFAIVMHGAERLRPLYLELH